MVQWKSRLEMQLVPILIMSQINWFYNLKAKTSKEARVTELFRSSMRKYYIKHNFHSDIFAWSYGIVNDSDHSIVAKLDMSQSSNLTYSTKGSTAKKTLKPRECAFMLHAQAGFGDFDKKVDHEVQHLKK